MFHCSFLYIYDIQTRQSSIARWRGGNIPARSWLWAMTSPRLALHNGLMQDLLSIKEVPDNRLPDMTRWLIEESLGCMTTWSQDRSSPGDPPFGKREDSCKPPQGERLYPCAWFQVQDPSAARLDLAHVSLVSANDILRIRRVSTGKRQVNGRIVEQTR